jgi:hypothetical protein
LKKFRFRSGVRLGIWSDSADRTVSAEYKWDHYVFDGLKHRWLAHDRAIQLTGNAAYDYGSYQSEPEPFQLVYNYQRDQIWTTLSDFQGHVSAEELGVVLKKLDEKASTARPVQSIP